MRIHKPKELEYCADATWAGTKPQIVKHLDIFDFFAFLLWDMFQKNEREEYTDIAQTRLIINSELTETE